ncbi:bolA-like protein DDB_G0274169 isoform X2 [Procambarus clarkii]|uniref:bolA-like protein DDB_G0274169 isoform X2 n=1 Tax=Procambarus clarkii TaxID=6728 RepID=UPI00374264BB
MRDELSAIWALITQNARQLRQSSLEVLLYSPCGPVESTLRNKLEEALHPTHIEIMNESYMHNVPPGSETHFKVLVVSEAFNDLSLIKRHRLVNATLSEELKKGVHALSIVARTPAQWAKEPQEIECSPACQGGFGK